MEGKKSFVLYADLIHTVKHLPDEQAGKLFKHILEYVNDNDPQSDDIVINLAFEPIKQQLKRDLTSWESKKKKRSEAGKKGGLAKASNAKQNVANLAVTVNDTVNVTVNDNDNDINTTTSLHRSFAHLKVTTEEHDLLLQDYTEDQIDDVYDSIQNHSKNVDFTSLYLTSLRWLKYRHPSDTDKPINKLTPDVLHVARCEPSYAKTLYDKGHEAQLRKEGISWK